MREPDVYGSETLADLEARCQARAKALGLAMDTRQTNGEAELIGWIHEARSAACAIIINAAAFSHMFEKILIANRGEIALRVLRACKELGMRRSRCIPPPTPTRCMCARRRKRLHRPAAGARILSQHPALLAACEITGADAVHPGYGFLSENARFAEILRDHGVTFIGPSPEHIRIMGDKIEAKRTAKRLGIPCVPGSEGASPRTRRRIASRARSAFRFWSRPRPAAAGAA
jgi:hypothetical protein